MWPLEHVAGIPVIHPPRLDVPLALDPAVTVVVADGHDDPLVTIFMLGPAVHRAAGRHVIVDIDRVADDLVHRAVEATQHAVEERAELVAIATPRAEVAVGCEQSNHAVE